VSSSHRPLLGIRWAKDAGSAFTRTGRGIAIFGAGGSLAWPFRSVTRPAADLTFVLVIAALSLSEATFVLGALTFLVAATTLYFTRFRPGRIVLHHVPTHLEWARGGINAVPDLYRVTLRLAASNPGAHPCVLERLVIDRVESEGSPEFAETAVGGRIMGTPGTEALSALIDPGGSKQFDFSFELQGLASTAIQTTPTPDLAPLATALRHLERLDFVIRADYQRTTRRGASTRVARLRIPLPVEQGRRAAAEFWHQQNRPDLADLAQRPGAGKRGTDDG
jgi:hypothetical protein